MAYFNNIKFNKDTLYFELNNNNIKLGLANAIRRIVQSEIPIYAISRNSIEFVENTSMLHNDIISQRIPFVPLLYHAFDDKDISKMSIKLDVSNENSPTIKSIYSGDLAFLMDNQPIDNKMFLLEDKILLAKLKPNQKISLSGKIDKIMAKYNNTAFSPTSIVSMIYKRDEKKLLEFKEKLTPEQYREFEIAEGDRHYQKLPNGEPAVYLFNIETIGSLTTTELITMSLDILYDKFNNLIENINANKIVIQTSNRLLNSFDFILEYEDDTIGFPIQLYLLTDPEIDYAGYRVVHPNEFTMLITTKLKNNNDIENNKKVFINNIKNIMNIVDEMRKEWSNVKSE